MEDPVPLRSSVLTSRTMNAIRGRAIHLPVGQSLGQTTGSILPWIARLGAGVILGVFVFEQHREYRKEMERMSSSARAGTAVNICVPDTNCEQKVPFDPNDPPPFWRWMTGTMHRHSARP